MRTLLFALLLLPAQDDWRATGRQGAVAAGGKEAVAAGIEILKAGGNAADGAVATLLAQSVTDWDQFCFGGEVPLLVYSAKTGEVEVIAGCGVAPVLALGLTELPGRGLRSTLVPAALDAILTLLERHGTRSFSACVAPAIRLLEDRKSTRLNSSH